MTTPEELHPQPEESIELRAGGETVYPFRNLTLLPIDDSKIIGIDNFFGIDSFIDNGYELVATKGIVINGVKTTLALIVSEPESEGDYGETPLGDVESKSRFFGRDKERVTAPLRLALLSTHITKEQFLKVSDSVLEIAIGDEKYFLTLQGNKAKDVNFYYENDDDKFSFVNRSLRGVDGHTKKALLPYDPAKLGTIGISLVEKSSAK